MTDLTTKTAQSLHDKWCEQMREKVMELCDLILAETNPVNVLGPPVVTHEMEKKARALRKKINL